VYIVSCQTEQRCCQSLGGSTDKIGMNCEKVSFWMAFDGVSNGGKSYTKRQSMTEYRSQLTRTLFTKFGGKSWMVCNIFIWLVYFESNVWTIARGYYLDPSNSAFERN